MMKKLLTTLCCIQLCASALAQDPDPGFTLWNGRFEKSDFEITIGYVNKSWVNTYGNGITQREDFFGESGKFLHGIQIGGLYTPSFDWGLGLRTGVMFEFYLSTNDLIKYYGWSSFNEADLFIPLHASFRIPFNDQSDITFFAGPGFQLAMAGRYSRAVGSIYRPWWRRPIIWGESKKMEYGYGWPERVNWQIDCGLNLRFGSFGLNLSYAFGIKDHGIQNTFDNGETYLTASRSRQDKITAGLAIMF